MGKQSVFDRLVSDLSPSERKEILLRIHRSTGMPEYSPLPGEEETEDGSIQEKFKSLSFLRKLFLLLKALLTGSGLEVQVRNHLLADLSRRTDTGHPGYADFRKKIWKSRFLNELVQLREDALTLTGLLSGSQGIERSEFVSLLAGSILSDIEERLHRETDPCRVFEEFPALSERELKSELDRRMDDCLSSMTSGDRSLVYEEFKFLAALKAFCSYPFHRLIAQFRARETPDTAECRFFEVQDQLPELCSVLAGLRAPSSSVLIDTLLLFYFRREPVEQPGDDGYTQIPEGAEGPQLSGKTDAEGAAGSTEKEFQAFSRKITDALGRVNSFRKNVPIVDFTRIAIENLSYRPQPQGGGEDWLAVYRQHWKEVLASRVSEFLNGRKRRSEIENACRLIGLQVLPPLPCYSNESLGPDGPVRFPLSMAFLPPFLDRIFFSRMNRPLKMLLIDGEFYKDDNRLEFTDAYNVLLTLRDRIRVFDGSFSPEGNIGAVLARTRLELISRNLKEKKIRTAVAEGDREAERIIGTADSAVASLVRILKGILHGEAGGKYDTLSNLGYLGGKGSREYIRSLERVLRELSDTGDILRALCEIERCS